MWKLNKKGFLLAETLVVIGIATAILVIFYEQISHSYHTYQKTSYYDSIQAIHAANNVKKIIKQDNILTFINALGANDIMDITNYSYTDAAYVTRFKELANIKKIYFSKYNLNTVIDTFTAYDFDALFIDYLKTLRLNNPTGFNDVYRIIIILNDNTFSSIKALYDTTPPTVAFGTNGSVPYVKSSNTTVTVTDIGIGINNNSLKYQWTTSAVAPSEASFSTVGVSFINGRRINTPVNVSGTYYLWILAKDQDSNTRITSSNLFHIDNTIPVITISGVDPVNVTRGTSYTDAGATATDNADGNISGSIVPTSTVDTGTVGTYSVTYNVSDSAGNTAIPVSRTVNVVP